MQISLCRSGWDVLCPPAPHLFAHGNPSKLWLQHTVTSFQTLNQLLSLMQVTCWEFLLFMSVKGAQWIIVIFVALGALASPSWRDSSRNCRTTREMLSPAFVKLACIEPWVWAEDLNAFPLSLNKVTHPIIRESFKWVRDIKLSCPPAPFGARWRGWQGLWQWAVHNPWQRMHTNMNHVVLKRSKWVYSGLLTLPCS